MPIFIDCTSIIFRFDGRITFFFKFWFIFCSWTFINFVVHLKKDFINKVSLIFPSQNYSLNISLLCNYFSPHDERRSSCPRPAILCSEQEIFQFLFRTINKIKFKNLIWTSKFKFSFRGLLFLSKIILF